MLSNSQNYMLKTMFLYCNLRKSGTFAYENILRSSWT